MTNLIFSLVVTVVTNVSDRVEPSRDSGIVLTVHPPQLQILPAYKIVTTTICRVTNFVSSAWYDIERRASSNGPNPKLVFESGRAVLAETAERFTEVTERKWLKDTNTPPNLQWWVR